MKRKTIYSEGLRLFSTGTRLFCDFPFGGKPKAKCIRVIEPGNGKSATRGRILVEITETSGAYRNGERIELTACQAVPLVMRLSLRKGQFFIRVSTCYAWT